MCIFVTFVLALVGVAQASAAPRTDKIFLSGLPGRDTNRAAGACGAVRAEYSYNDRGRGDHIVATWKLDADGVPIEYEGRGNDYMKAPVEERFEIKNGRASWKNRSEHGDQAVTGKAFYLPMNAPPEFTRRARARFAESAKPQTGAPPGRRSEHRGGGQGKRRFREGRVDPVPHHGSWLLAAIDLAGPRW